MANSPLNQILNNVGNALHGAGQWIGNQAQHMLAAPQQGNPSPIGPSPANIVGGLVSLGRPLGDMAHNVGNYFDPNSTAPNGGPNGFWSNTNHFAKVIAGQEAVPQLHQLSETTYNGFNNLAGGGTPGMLAGTAASLPANIIEGIVNVPSQLAQFSINQAKDINTGQVTPQHELADLGTLAEPLLTVGTLGESSILKELAKDSWKMGAIKGLVNGTIIGGGYGLAQGLQQGKDAKSVTDQVTQSLPSVIHGMVTGGVLGGVLSPAAKIFFGGKPGEAAAMADKNLIPVATLDDAHQILNIKPGASLDEARNAYAAAYHEFHPEKGGTPEALQILNSAYEMITKNKAPQVIKGKEGYSFQWDNQIGGHPLTPEQEQAAAKAGEADQAFRENLNQSTQTPSDQELALDQLNHQQGAPTPMNGMSDEELAMHQLRQNNPQIQYPDPESQRLRNLVAMRDGLHAKLQEHTAAQSDVTTSPAMKGLIQLRNDLQGKINKSDAILSNLSTETNKPAVGVMPSKDIQQYQKGLQKDIAAVTEKIRARIGDNTDTGTVFDPETNTLITQRNELLQEYNQGNNQVRLNQSNLQDHLQPQAGPITKAEIRTQKNQLKAQLKDLDTKIADQRSKLKLQSVTQQSQLTDQIAQLEKVISDEQSRLRVKSSLDAPVKAELSTSPVEQQKTPAQEAFEAGRPIENTTGQQATAPETTPGRKTTDEHIAAAINESDLPSKSKVNILDYFLRTPEQVLDRLGLKNIGQRLRGAYEATQHETHQELERITQWSKQVSPKENQEIFRHLDGQNVTLSPKAAQVAGEIQTYLSSWADKLGLPHDQRIAHYITHIFENGSGQVDPALQHILRNKLPSEVHDPFLQQRLGKQGYVEDTWRALDAYIKRAVKKTNLDPVLNELSTTADHLEGSQLNYIKTYISRMNGTPTQFEQGVDNLLTHVTGSAFGGRPTRGITTNMRQMVYRGLLGLNPASALKNLTQGVNTYAQLGEKHTLYGYYKVMQNLPRFLANKDSELERVGVLHDNFVEDRELTGLKSALQKTGAATDKGLFYMFSQAEKINRGAAYFGAKQQGLERGMSEEAAIDYAKEIVRKTQFNFGNMDTPLHLQDPIAKTLTQMQTFTIKQGEFLGGLGKDMVTGKNKTGLLRYAASSFLLLSTIGAALGMKPSDMVPSARFGAPPTLKLPVGAYQAITQSTDKYGNPLTPEQRILNNNVVSGGMSYIPAGGALLKAGKEYAEEQAGGSYTSAGNLRYPANPNSNVMAYLQGPSSNPYSKDYYDKNLPSLNKAETEQYKLLVDNDTNPGAAYAQIRAQETNNDDFKALLDTNTKDEKKSPLTGGILGSVMSLLGMAPKQANAESTSDTTSTQATENTGNPLLDAINKEKNQDEDVKKIMKIYQSGLPEDKMEAALKKEGIDPVEANTKLLASLKTDNRAPLLWNMFNATDSDKQQDLMHDLVRKDLLTTGITAEWVVSGYIDYDTKKALDKQIGVINGTSNPDAGAGKKSTTQKKIESIISSTKMPSARITLGKASSKSGGGALLGNQYQQGGATMARILSNMPKVSDGTSAPRSITSSKVQMKSFAPKVSGRIKVQ